VQQRVCLEESSMYQTVASGYGSTRAGRGEVLEEVLAFRCVYFDQQSMLNKSYQLKYYSETDSIEVIDIKNRKLFLKKCQRPETLDTKHLFKGGKIYFHGRQMTIEDYDDAATAERCGNVREEAFITQPLGPSLPLVLRAIDNSDMIISRLNAVYNEKNEVVVAISAIGPNSNAVLNERGVKTRGDLSASQKDAYFTNDSNFASALNSSTCVIIQPSAVIADQASHIIQQIIDQGYEISGMGMFEMRPQEAAEFLEVYKDSVSFYKQKVAELSSGRCIAIEVRCEEAVKTFRETAGPWDVDMARELAPQSIRGQFGQDNARNAVHCTDLPSDAFDEVNYFFGDDQNPAMIKPVNAAR